MLNIKAFNLSFNPVGLIRLKENGTIQDNCGPWKLDCAKGNDLCICKQTVSFRHAM